MEEIIPFATEAWIKRLGDECNRSEAYRQAARNWEGDVCFIVEPEGEPTEPIYLYMDLYHGRCRRALILEDDSAVSPEFCVRGTVSTWKAITQKEVDPFKALMMRKLSLKGNMAKVMRNMRAANELVNCTTRIETEFPV